MALARRWSKRLARVVLALVATLALCLAAAAALLATEGGQRLAARWVGTALSDAETRVAIDRLTVDWSGAIALNGLALADAQGRWLSADEVRLSWRPLALLGGRLTVDRLQVGSVDWPRLPAGQGRAGGALPLPPLSLSVRHFALRSLQLGADVVGAPARLAADGAFGADGHDEIRSRLRIRRIDATPAEATLEATLRPGARWLALTLLAEEPAGGLLPHLIGVPDRAFALHLAGEGPLEAWRGKLAARVGDAPLLDFDIAAGDRPRLHVALSGHVDLSHHLPELSARGLELEATLSSADGANWRLENSRWRLDGIEAALSGAVALADGPRLDLDVTLRKSADARLPYLPAMARIGAVNASGRIAGPLDRPTVRLRVQAEAADLAPFGARGLQLEARFQPSASLLAGPPAGEIELSGGAEHLSVADARLAPLLDGAARLELALRVGGDEGRLETSRLRLALGNVSLEGGGEHVLATGIGSFTGKFTLADVAALDRGGRLGLAGAVDAETRVGWDLARQSFSGHIAGRARDLGVADRWLQALLGRAPSFTAELRRAADGRLAVDTASLTGTRLRLAGNGSLSADGERLAARFRGGLPDLAALAAVGGIEAGGRASFAGEIGGAPTAPRGRITLQAEAATLGGVALEGASAEAEVRPAGDGFDGRLQAALTVGPGPLQLGAELRRRGAETHLDRLHLAGQGLEVKGDLALGDGRPALAGRLAVTVAELSPWLALAGVEASGALKGELVLAERDGRQGVQATGDLSAFRLPLGSRAITGESAHFTASAQWPPEARAIEAAVDGKELRLGDAVAHRLSLRLSGTPEDARFSAKTEGSFHGAFSLGVAGTLGREDGGLRIALSRLDGHVLGAPVRLTQPGRIRLAAGGASFEAVRLALATGTLALDGRLDAGSADLSLRVAALPLTPLAAFGADLEGRLDGRLEIRGAWPTPVGSAEITLAGLRWRGYGDLPPVAGHLGARWQAGRLTLDAAIDAGTGPPLRLTAGLPLRVDAAPWSWRLPAQEQVSLALAWQGDAGMLWSLLPFPAHRLSGALAVDLRIAGTIDQPHVDGSLTLSHGAYENLEHGTRLRDLELRVVTDGSDTLRIERLSAGDGDGGRLSGQGQITFRDLNALVYDARVKLENFRFVRRDDMTGRVDGNIEITGRPGDRLIRGRLTTRSIDATLIDSLGGDVVELDVVEIGGKDGKSARVREAGHLPAFRLDVTVTIPGQAFLRGRGLESEWAGEITVTGTTLAPVLGGQLHVVRGTFTFLGKSFRIESGTVQPFTVDSRPDARLHITARYSARDLEATITVGDTVSKPSFTWSSQPTLPRDEIIARLLFGKGTGQLSAFEAVQLAGALAELSGRGTGAVSLLERARRSLGVDILQFTGDAQAAGGARLEAGKYLSKKVYVGVEQGSEAGSTGARVELQVLPHVNVESELQASGANIGAKFKWDY